MIIVKAKIALYENEPPLIVPIVIPALTEVRKFATKRHAQEKSWNGDAFGWQATYTPQRSTPPLNSKITFTPADFCIGESGI